MAIPITIYSTPTCAFCHMVKQYLGAKDIPFETKDVSMDAAAFQEMYAKTHQLGVPVIDIDGKVVIGFDRPRIDALLREKGAA